MITKIKNSPTSFFVANGGSCAYSAITTQKQYGHTIQWGQLFIWDESLYSFDLAFSNFHMWNRDSDGSVIDDLQNLDKATSMQNFRTNPISNWSVAVIDVNDLPNEIHSYESFTSCIKRLKKLYRGRLGKVDAIYITGLAFADWRRSWAHKLDEEYVQNVIVEQASGSLGY
jgi:hypothetical protein